MAVDQSGTQEGVPERFAPKEMRGQLIEAEHLARYRWAAAIAAGKRVLDAGCGTAYGTALLAEAGAREVVGVDIAENVLESVRSEMPDAVTLQAGNLLDLDLEDDSFDLVVCFEVIEHFEDPQTVLDQLTRVLAADGVLLISSPNRGVYPAGNPHHHHEFKPAELSAELQSRLGQVRLMRQHSYVASAVFSDERFAATAETPLEGLPLYKLVADDLDSELFTLAIASAGPLPEMPPALTLTSSLALGEWVSISEAQEQALQEHRRYIHELETKVAERAQLQHRLIEAEQQLAAVPGLEQEVTELARANKLIEDERAGLAAQLHSTETSFSWRLTKPLREGKASFARFLGRG
jgi:SAM-dependent methyltransferase